MKRTSWSALLLAGGLFISGCGKEDSPKSESTKSDPSREEQSATDNTSEVTTASAISPKPEAISGQSLKSFLPKINGFKAETEANVQPHDLMGQKYEMAKQLFSKGEKLIEVVIADYNSIASLTAAYKMMMGSSIETTNEVTKGEEFKGFPGWVMYRKDYAQAQAGVAVNDRIWVIIQADHGVTIDQVRSVMNSIDLAKLATLN